MNIENFINEVSFQEDPQFCSDLMSALTSIYDDLVIAKTTSDENESKLEALKQLKQYI